MFGEQNIWNVGLRECYCESLLGFGGAVKDRRIIVFVKKQRNKDQETDPVRANRERERASRCAQLG